MNEIERAKEYPALKEKRLTRNDIIEGNINMLDSGAHECRKIGKLASAEEKEIIAEILRAELSRQENAPLTIDEIKELYEASFSGYPVWCRYLNEYSYPFGAVIDRCDGEIVAVHAAGLKDDELNREEDYGQTWLAYRYEPKGHEE